MNRAEIYQQRLLPLLERFDPEAVHCRTLDLLRLLETDPLTLKLVEKLGCRDGRRYQHPLLSTRVAGLELENPLLVAAGFDKDALAPRALIELGFSSVEIGTVTLHPQAGNDKPRLWRLPDNSLLNALGFPSAGAAAVRQNLSRCWPRTFPLGVSLGINKTTHHEEAASDMATLAYLLDDYADYFVLNISSPNTPFLRTLHTSPFLAQMVVEIRYLIADAQKPLLLKISPDLSPAELNVVMRFALDNQISGIIATNTSLDYSLNPQTVAAYTSGGISGQSLQALSTSVLRHLYRESGGALDLIGSGGVNSLESLLDKFFAGAKAVSIYTGLVSVGPTLPTALNEQLVDWLYHHQTTLDGIIGQDK